MLVLCLAHKRVMTCDEIEVCSMQTPHGVCALNQLRCCVGLLWVERFFAKNLGLVFLPHAGHKGFKVSSSPSHSMIPDFMV